MIDRWSPRALCHVGAPGALQPIPPARFASKSARPIGQPAGRAGLPARPVGQLGQDVIPFVFQSLRVTPRVWPGRSCWQRGPRGLPASAPERFANKTDRATGAQAIQGALLQTARASSQKFAGEFFCRLQTTIARNANDRQKCQRSPQKNNDESTIDNDRQGSINDRQRYTTIGPRESTHVQRSAYAKGTIFFPEMYTDEPTSAPHRDRRPSAPSPM